MTKNDPPLPFFLKTKVSGNTPPAPDTDRFSEQKTPEQPTEFNIPTLRSIAIPDEENQQDDASLLEPVLIGPEHGGFNTGGPPPESVLNGEDIQYITAKLRATLLPEIDKIVSYAMNHAFALAMDQASHVLRQRVHAKVDEILPQLVRDAIKNPPRKP